MPTITLFSHRGRMKIKPNPRKKSAKRLRVVKVKHCVTNPRKKARKKNLSAPRNVRSLSRAPHGFAVKVNNRQVGQFGQKAHALEYAKMVHARTGYRVEVVTV